MKKRYVLDTNSLIRYFPTVFGQYKRLSYQAQAILDHAFLDSADTLVSIPSVVFVEVFDKWLRTEKAVATFRYEVFERVLNSENFEIRPVDAEVMECLTRLDGLMMGHDLHDKIILASAIVLDCPLITSDTVIRDYVNFTNIIPSVIS